jgi:hypothetical protein
MGSDRKALEPIAAQIGPCAFHFAGAPGRAARSSLKPLRITRVPQPRPGEVQTAIPLLYLIDVTVSRAVGRRQESETRTFGAVTEDLRALAVVTVASLSLYMDALGSQCGQRNSIVFRGL